MSRVVVITGAAGNLGVKLRDHLAARGDYDLRLIDIDPRSDPEVQAADLSVVDRAWTDRFAGADAVVHLAANASSAADWDALIGPNVDASLNVYFAAARHDVRRVVLASSVWAMAGQRFGAETLRADAPDPGPNAYGATKLFAERIAHAAWANHGISTVALRLGGCRPGDNAPAPNDDPWEEQCWLSNDDACRGLELAITADIQGAHVVNLVSRNPESRWSLDEAYRILGYVPMDAGGSAASPRGRLRRFVDCVARVWTRARSPSRMRRPQTAEAPRP